MDMISLHNITRIENRQEPIFDEDSPIVRKIILYKEQDVLLEHGEFVSRYGIFITKDGCESINGLKFDCCHHFEFKNDELSVERDLEITEYDEDYDEDYDFDRFVMNKYNIEGKQGMFWLIINSAFFIYGDMPPEDILSGDEESIYESDIETY